MTGFYPKDNLAFFAALRRNHFPPFYFIPTLHQHPDPNDVTSSPIKPPVRKVLRTLDDAIAVLPETNNNGIAPTASEVTEEGGSGTLETVLGFGTGTGIPVVFRPQVVRVWVRCLKF